MAGRRRSLSDLPDNALEAILCRMPIIDAARTSVLSRCWRRRWLSIPRLDLSDLSRSQIYHILSLHSGPVHFFKAEELDPDDGGCEMWRSFDVERWLTVLSLHSASSFRTLVLCFRDLDGDFELIRRCFPYLTHLELSGCLFVPLPYTGFSSLRGLYLHHFTTYSEDSEDYRNCLSRLISGCPLLETLRLYDDYENSDVYHSLDIIAPNLRQINLEGLQLYDLTVTSAPLLEIVRMDTFLDFERDEDDNGGDGAIADCRLMKVFGGMTTIKKLEVNYVVLEFLGRTHVPKTIPICFNNLCIISFNVEDETNMLVVLCLLRSCPNLRELIMDQGYYWYRPLLEVDQDIWESEAQDDIHLFNNLVTVIMTQIMCTRLELSFIKFVLAKAQVLKTVKISFRQEVKTTDSFVADLLEFPRVSDQARILLTRNSRETARRSAESYDHSSPDLSDIAGSSSAPPDSAGPTQGESNQSLMQTKIHDMQVEILGQLQDLNSKMQARDSEILAHQSKTQAQFDMLYQHLHISPPASHLGVLPVSAQPINNPLMNAMFHTGQSSQHPRVPGDDQPAQQ